eukprot:6207214-Pleurochrysis_carterae.AAC.1
MLWPLRQWSCRVPAASTSAGRRTCTFLRVKKVGNRESWGAPDAPSRKAGECSCDKRAGKEERTKPFALDCATGDMRTLT